MIKEISVFWFRRDLRIEDNLGLFKAIDSGLPVLPIFIFDENILSKLPKDDARVSFIHSQLVKIDTELKKHGSSLLVLHGKPQEVWANLTEQYSIKEVFCCKDYEPYALERDANVGEFLKSKVIGFQKIKDQVVFEESEIVKSDGMPYTVYTPYKNRWIEKFRLQGIEKEKTIDYSAFFQIDLQVLRLEDIGFQSSKVKVKDFNLKELSKYSETRNFPSLDATSYLSPHLRFGTVSVRQIIRLSADQSEVFLSELIWREFFMQILFHFPNVVNESFSPKYRKIAWRNNEKEFKQWCEGKTGYPIVDAGMRQLNETGYMHNRVRMVVASFLCKHLLIDWRWGEAYFSEKLLDYDLSANNGNWQWAAGTGCDAAPYFRVFNPYEQVKKFDDKLLYIKKWVKDLNEFSYPKPMVEHTFARNRALETYKSSILT